jgi:hypothetical protein
MKKLFCLLIVCGIALSPVVVQAAPFLTSDAQPADAHRVNWTGTWEAPVPANTDGSAWIDLGPLAPGAYPGAQIQAGNEYTLDGVGQGVYVWSAPTPFSLTKPVVPLDVTGLDIIDNTVGM